MVRGDERSARAGKLHAADGDVALEVDVIEVQEGKEAGIGPPALEMRKEAQALQPLSQDVVHEAAAPFVEVAEHHPGAVHAPVVHPGGEPRRLIAALQQCAVPRWTL